MASFFLNLKQENEKKNPKTVTIFRAVIKNGGGRTRKKIKILESKSPKK